MPNDVIRIHDSLKENNIPLQLYYGTIVDFNNNPKNYDYKNSIISPISKKIKEKFDLKTLKDEVVVQRYRTFYWDKLGIDPTKRRPAGEALVRRILHGNGLYKINFFVDGYNWASAAMRIPISAYDMDSLELPILARFARKNEEFKDIAGKVRRLQGNEVVLSDQNGQIVTQFPFRDANKTKITKKTRNILIVVLGIGGLKRTELEATFNKILFNLQKGEATHEKSFKIKIEKKGFVTNV